SLKVSKGTPPIEGEARTTIYRITQEALANIARHAGASHVDVSIQGEGEGGSIRVEIADNGQGFDADAESHAKIRGRLGLLGMRERVEMIGGAFAVHSRRGAGTTVTVSRPKRGPAQRDCPPKKQGDSKVPAPLSGSC